MLKFVAVVAITYLGVALADPVQFKDCGSVSGTINSVDVTPCGPEPCKFPRNHTVHVVVNYTANAAITQATTKVYGYILGVKVSFPLPSDACQDMTCPIAKGDHVTYVNNIPIKPTYPTVSLVVQWEVHDQDNNFIVCFNVPVEITPS